LGGGQSIQVVAFPNRLILLLGREKMAVVGGRIKGNGVMGKPLSERGRRLERPQFSHSAAKTIKKRKKFQGKKNGKEAKRKRVTPSH